MTENLYKPVILSQLEDALEERQRADRRKQEAAAAPADRQLASVRTEPR